MAKWQSIGLSRPRCFTDFARLTLAFFFLMHPTSVGFGQQKTVLLDDGMILGPGMLSDVAYVVEPRAKVGGGGEFKALIIHALDDGLRRTYFNVNRRAQEPVLANRAQLTIELANTNLVATEGEVPPGSIVQCSDFDPFGRRICFVRQGDKLHKVVQGITEITPTYVRVQGLKGDSGERDWDMRLALSNFESETLNEILLQNANTTKPNDRIAIVNLFEEAKRYDYARKNLEQAILKFNPALDSFKPVLTRLDQNMADQLFEASDMAVQAGQYQHANRLLETIQKAKLSIETGLKVESKMKLLQNGVTEHDELIAWITEDIARVEDPATRAEMQSLLPEISRHLRADTAIRFTDYFRRRRDDKTLKPDQLAAIALSGWIYGSAAGKDNAAFVASGIKTRRLVADYLSKPTRENQIVEEIRKQESGSADLVAKILSNMPPPLSTPESSAIKVLGQSTDGSSSQVEQSVVGRFAIEVPLSGEMHGQVARYLVQLPPEYNPFRQYPCVFTLPGELTNPAWQIKWWAGQYAPESQRCLGEASKRGYIVVSPDWREPNQPNYNYTENEHALVLAPLRDAMRRFSIDPDRVYLSGHFMGGDAAWDIALAHPDLWAGSVIISGQAEKYVIQNWENSLYVPTYFVSGEYDAFNESSGKEWGKVISRKQYDCLITLYRGRKPDHFREELPRIMDWMSFPARVRKPTPKKLEVKTSRGGDKFFWWFEAKELFQEKLDHPLLYSTNTGYSIAGSINKDAENGSVVSLPGVPASDFIIWLSPEFVNFEKEIVNLAVKSTTKRIKPKGDIQVMLEDVRGRADRQHPFWMRVDYSKTAK